MSEGPIYRNHLRACHEHAVVRPEGDDGALCPVCETDAEARPGAVDDIEFSDLDLRWQIAPDTMVELLDALLEDAEREGVGPVYVAVAEISKQEVRHAAGYTDQERWWNVAVVETGTNSREVIRRQQDAREAIDAIREGDGYLEAAEVDHGHLKPQAWGGIADIYCREVEYEQVDETTLRIHMDRFPSDSAYSQARSEIGDVCDMVGLGVRTIQAGGQFSEGVVEVFIDE